MGALVLVVEDHATVRRGVRDILISEGFTVVTAESVAAANRFMLGRDANFFFLVTDINLKDGLGWNVARAARAIWPKLHVLYMSSEDPEDFADKAVPDSAFVSKPFGTPELSRALGCLGLRSKIAEPAGMAMAG